MSRSFRKRFYLGKCLAQVVETCCSFVLLNKRLLYIINPIAGSGSRSSLHELIRQYTESAGIPYEMTASSKDGNYQALAQKIQENKITQVIIAGGDGTVSQVIAALKHTGVHFGILPCGSGNGLARAAKIPLNMKAAVQFNLEGQGKPTDGFLINNEFACMLSGLGFDATVAHSFAQQPARGFYTYAKEVIKNFNKASPFQFNIHTSNTSLYIDAFFISIANANQYGNNFLIAPKASLDDGLLDVVMLTRQSKLSLLWETLRQLTGQQPVVHPHQTNADCKLVYWQVNELQIENLSKAPLHIDGDPVPYVERAKFSVVPQAFSLIR